MCSVRRRATTWRWCASRTARSPASASETRTGSNGMVFRGCCVTRRRAGGGGGRGGVGEWAAVGAAVRAFHGEQVAQGREIGWEEVVAGFVEPVARVRPDPSSVAVYAGLKPVYAACEAHALGRGPDPTPLVEAFRSGLDPD